LLQDDEARLVKEVFVQIRCGHLEQAQLLCMHTGQEWRAAAMEGWHLHHDPNYETARGIDEVDKLPVEGNPNRLLCIQIKYDHTNALLNHTVSAV
jgi:nuclear pore complex protein Nup107